MGRPTNLQPALKSFVGRADELRRLDDLLSRHRLVTVVGAGGMGKTRLALEYMRRRIAAAPSDLAGGVWFCDLTETHDVRDVCREVARALGTPLQVSGGNDALIDAVGDVLARRGEQLLVLDNCEMIADYLSATLARWHASARDTRFVVTSRERLRLDSEVTLELGSLGLPAATATDAATVGDSDAVGLFVERAARIADGFVLGPANAGVINQIVHRLDGMPLAIELAAARANVLAPADLLQRLTRRFEVLASSSRQVADRHRTLRAAIDWSWNLLAEWEQAGLAQLSAFRGGFTIEAADAVVRVQEYDGAPDVLGGLQWLRDRSLIWASAPTGAGTRRFGLYSSIRDYGDEKLVELGVREATWARHARHFAACVGPLARRSVDAEAAHLLDTEEQNLLVAFHRAVERWAGDAELLSAGVECLLALEPLRVSRGSWVEYEAQLSRAIAAPAFETMAPVMIARAYHARGRMLGLTGRLSASRNDFERAADWAHRAGDSRVAGAVLLRLGVLANNDNRFDEARELYERALTRLREVGDRHGEGQALGNMAVLDGQLGRYDDARRWFAEAQAIYSEVGDRQLRARTIGNLAALLQDEGKLEEAELRFGQAIAELRALGNRRDVAVFVGALGILAQERGDWAAAGARYTEAIAELRSIGDRPFEALLMAHAATALAAEDDVEGAARMLTEAEALWAVARPGDDAAELLLYRSHLDLALARQCEASGDTRSAGRHRRLVAERLAVLRRGRDTGAPAQAARVAIRLLEQALARAPAAVKPAPSDALAIGAGAEWFQLPGEPRVDLARRHTLRRLLLCLAQQHRDAPGRGSATEELFRAGWPGERAARDAAANRVRVAVTTLRKLGLRDYLVTRGDGYLLVPELAIEHIDV